jgi:hypothetical protein
MDNLSKVDVSIPIKIREFAFFQEIIFLAKRKYILRRRQSF